MAKNSNQELANQFFKENKEAATVYVCDGYTFKTKNAAELLGNSAPKKRKTFEFSRKEETNSVNSNSNKPSLNLDKLNKTDLIKVAESKGIRPDDSNTKAEIIALIEAVVVNSKTED